MNPLSHRSRHLVAGVLAFGLLAASCGDDGSATTVDGAWARTSPMNAEAGAIYFTISSDDAVVITGASVGDDVAGRVEIHETVMADMSDDMDDMGDDMSDDMDDMSEDDHEGHDMGGAMMMQQVPSVAVAAGEDVSFEPGGLHVMLLELPDPLELGETFELTLALENGDSITVDVEVRDEAP